MKKVLMLSGALLLASTMLLVSCSGNSNAQDNQSTAIGIEPTQAATAASHLLSAGDVPVTASLNQDWVKAGKATYELKCQSCHKLTNEKLVGPGWKGVTQTRKPEWIMNMILNTDDMLNSDPEAQKLLEEHLVRMPNQNLTKDEARQVLEFMRNNDGAK